MITLFLAAFLGWYLLIISLLLLTREPLIRESMIDITGNRGLFFILALLTVIFGLLMVLSHNIWDSGWPVLITILSWLILISGLLRLFFPEKMLKMAKDLLASRHGIRILAIINLAIGLFLLYKAY